NTPQCYINLMRKCWDKDPVNRPPAIKICEIFTEWQNDENILLELIKSEEILENIRTTHLQTYPNEVYKSKFINYTTPIYQ
ncbi:9823_t:CDS:1, partial [Cetraspora pellucida]